MQSPRSLLLDVVESSTNFKINIWHSLDAIAAAFQATIRGSCVVLFQIKLRTSELLFHC